MLWSLNSCDYFRDGYITEILSAEGINTCGFMLGGIMNYYAGRNI